MAKSAGQTERRIDLWRRQGRGSGTGADYLPWNKIADLKSKGRGSRILGRTTGRVHHLRSDGHRRVFLDLDWQPNVSDIREQYPLDRRITRLIAASLGLRHPRDPKTKSDIVMTTDFLVNLRRPEAEALIAIRFTACGRETTRSKIEKQYWTLRGVEFQNRDASQTSARRAENLMFLHEYHTADTWPCAVDGYWDARVAHFLQMLQTEPSQLPFCLFASRFEAAGGFCAR